ncbi:MAG: hypothetical protein AVDCRST_MAG19-641, partial [uncultured Thermomicrobiales bacterium]
DDPLRPPPADPDPRSGSIAAPFSRRDPDRRLRRGVRPTRPRRARRRGPRPLGRAGPPLRRPATSPV